MCDSRTNVDYMNGRILIFAKLDYKLAPLKFGIYNLQFYAISASVI